MQLAISRKALICSLQNIFALIFWRKIWRTSNTWFCGKNYFFNSRHATCRENSVASSRAAETNNQTKTMSTLTAKGNWNIAKGKLKQKFAQLTDDDLQFAEGKEDELIGRIQKRTRRDREKIGRIVDECCGCRH